MTLILLIVAGWLVCAVASYILVRIFWRLEGFSWVRRDRRVIVFVSMLGGPLLTVWMVGWTGGAIVAAAVDKLLGAGDDIPARW